MTGRLTTGRPTVLMYHGFAVGLRTHDPYDLHVDVAQLDAQLALLRRRRRPVDLDGYLEVLDGRAPSRRAVLVTIDDALASVASLAAPVLSRHGVPSVLFVPTGLVGATSSWLSEMPDEPLLDAAALRGLSAAGVELGVHGWDHTSMTGMSDTDLRRAVIDARDALADVSGVQPRAFAYPYGDLDRRAVEAVARAGYAVAFSVYRDDGRHAVSRTDVKPADSLRAVRIKLAAGPRYRLVWRAVGRLGPVRSTLRALAQRR